MTRTENSDLSYDERLSIAVDEINDEFPELPAERKVVEAAYTEHRQTVLDCKET